MSDVTIINEKTKIPLVWLGAIIVCAISIVFRFSSLDERTSVQEVKYQSIERRQTIIEDDLKQSLKRLEDKNDKLAEKIDRFIEMNRKEIGRR